MTILHSWRKTAHLSRFLRCCYPLALLALLIFMVPTETLYAFGPGGGGGGRQSLLLEAEAVVVVVDMEGGVPDPLVVAAVDLASIST